MAHVGNGASVRAAAPGYTDAMRRPANPRTGDHQPLQIPPGGHAHIEKAEDGTVIATAHDRNYNVVGGCTAPSADCLDVK